ncbi:MAG: hypothetical protein OXE94_08650 [Aestuariivita sp.]|nr:hypothetical protein [Aestuariivita sp.]MCY4202450.1 hypothetical protein [Aestuariivita sp.]
MANHRRSLEYASNEAKELVVGENEWKIRFEQIKTQLLEGAAKTEIAELTPYRDHGTAIARSIDCDGAENGRMRDYPA